MYVCIHIDECVCVYGVSFSRVESPLYSSVLCIYTDVSFKVCSYWFSAELVSLSG